MWRYEIGPQQADDQVLTRKHSASQTEGGGVEIPSDPWRAVRTHTYKGSAHTNGCSALQELQCQECNSRAHWRKIASA